MTLSRRDLLKRSALLATAMGFWRAGVVQAATQPLPATSPELQLLQRFSFGVHADDLARVQAMGFTNYLEEQLFQGGLDPTVEQTVASWYPTVVMSTEALGQLTENEAMKPGQIAAELKQATIYRAVKSQYQLYEVMVDFWTNHLNVYHRDGPIRILKTIDDREVIRAHALGTFRALLHASAKSPAMLVYLDNYSSKKEGYNENYARELMELHTLGVDGGYHHHDVEEVARILTGWSITRRGDQRGQFQFISRFHDYDEKQVMGEFYPAGVGQAEGERLLDQLVDHPSTHSFVARKLCERFVSDAPSEALIQSVASAWGDDGDIKQMLLTLISSDEFYATDHQKFRRPNDLMYALFRTSGTSLQQTTTRALMQGLSTLDQLPFDAAPPTGYPASTQAWLSTSGLLNRWNLISQALGYTATSERPRRRSLIQPEQWVSFSSSVDDLVNQLITQLLHDQIDDEGRTLLIDFAQASAQELNTRHQYVVARDVAALIFASPYFQWL